MDTTAIVDKDNMPFYMAWNIWTEMIQPFDENFGVHESFRSNCWIDSSNGTLVHSREIKSLNWENEEWRNRKSIGSNTGNNLHMKLYFHTFWAICFWSSNSNKISYPVLLRKPHFIHVENTIVCHFRSVTCFINYHVKTCRPYSVTSALTRLITWEVRVVNNGCQFMNRFNHPLSRYPDDQVVP